METTMGTRRTPRLGARRTRARQPAAAKPKRKAAAKPMTRHECRGTSGTATPILYGTDDFPAVWNELRYNVQLCDGVVFCRGLREIKVHRVILSAVSPYFRALFTNSINRNQPETTEAHLDMPADTFDLILDYAYTGKVNITDQNVNSLLVCSDQLEIIGIVDLCCEHILNNLNIDNCITVFRFSRQYFLKYVEKLCADFIVHHFDKVLKRCADYYNLASDELYEFLSHDELNVKSEEEVFGALRLWFMFDPTERKQSLPKLLECIRFGLINVDFFSAHVLNWCYVQKSKECGKFMLAISNCLSNQQRLIDMYPDYRAKLTSTRVPFEFLFAFGGWSDGNPIGFAESYDSRADRWIVLGDIEMSPRAYHGTCTLGGLIYVIGGFDGHEHFNTMKSFDPVARKWREHACMYYPRCYVSVAVDADNIYAIGGYNGKSRMNSVERYDPRYNQWKLLAPMNLHRSDASAAAVNGRLYVVGGFNGHEVLRSAEMYDVRDDQWTYIHPMGNARSGVSLVAHRDRLYAVGGFDGVQRLSSIERYSLDDVDDWHLLDTMPNARSNFSAEIMDGRLFIIGGYDGKGTIANCECYDFETEIWSSVKRMNLTRSALSTCVLADLPNAKEYSYMNA